MSKLYTTSEIAELKLQRHPDIHNGDECEVCNIFATLDAMAGLIEMRAEFELDDARIELIDWSIADSPQHQMDNAMIALSQVLAVGPADEERDDHGRWSGSGVSRDITSSPSLYDSNVTNWKTTLKNGQVLSMNVENGTGWSKTVLTQMINTIADLHETFGGNSPPPFIKVQNEYGKGRVVSADMQNNTIIISDKASFTALIADTKTNTGTSEHMPSYNESNPLTYFLNHEYGHINDVNSGDGSATKLWDAVKSELSPYGQTKPVEGYAEAFAEYTMTKGETTNVAAQTYATTLGWDKEESAILASIVRAEVKAAGFNQDQERDDHGRWSGSGGGSGAKDTSGSGKSPKARDDSTLQGRLGNCYRLAAKYVLDKRDGTKLVHGSIQGMGNPRIDHAWAVRPNGTVHDAVLQEDFPQKVHDALFNAETDHTYTKEQVLDQTVATGHWGPWENGATTVAELQQMSPDELEQHMHDVSNRINTGLSLQMDTLHTYDMVNGIEGLYTDEREKQQMKIINDVLDQPGVEYDNQLLIMAGLPGAGKSTFLNQSALLLGIDVDKYVTVNPDDIRDRMIKAGMVPDYSSLKLTTPEASSLFHEEASYLAGLAAVEASNRGMNILVDTTLKSQTQFDRYTNQISPRGTYATTVILVDTDKQTSIERALGRYVHTGRYTPLNNIMNLKDDAQGHTAARQTFDGIVDKVDRAILVDSQRNIVFDKVNNPGTNTNE